MTCDLVMASEMHCLDQGQTNRSYHFKILVPHVAAGAIIGEGGVTIAQLQKETGAKVKLSKAADFYPGTTERVCLIRGNVEAILRIHDFIMEKIRQKPDFKAKLEIDFDHKQPVAREKQVKILVPNSTAGMIIGKSGSYIKQIKEESGAYVQISQKSPEYALPERCVTIIGDMENNKAACRMILAKIVEDPQSSSCLNISYADVTGPVANCSPTGSPFANPDIVPSVAASKSNTCSDGSSNSPSIASTFHSPESSSTHSRILPFTGFGFDPVAPPQSSGQVIENFKTTLRGNGYSEEAVSEIGAAMNTLSNYRIFNLGPGMLDMINSASVMSGLGMEMPRSAEPSCPVLSQSMTNQTMYPSVTAMPGMEDSCGSVDTSGSVGNECSIFCHCPIHTLEKFSIGSGFTSPTEYRSSDRLLMEAEKEQFRRTCSELASPSAVTVSVNDNSFGLATAESSPSPTSKTILIPSRRRIGDTMQVEIEVGESIVGAILGPGGKSLVEIQRVSGANIQISKKGIFVPGTRNRIVTITGSPNAIGTAQYLIQNEIAEEEAKRAGA